MLPHREDGQHDRGEQEGGRRVLADAEARRERHVAEHRRFRGSAGDGQEQDADQADRLGLELCDIGPVGDVDRPES